MPSIIWVGYTIYVEDARKVDAASDRFGVPRNFTRATGLVESSGNPNAVGDSGHSVGFLQLFDEGQGAGMTVAERKDLARNLEVGMPYLRDGWRKSAGITPMRERVKVAAGYAGHPNSLDAGESGREAIAAMWERLEAADPDPAGKVNVAGIDVSSERIEAKVQGAIDYARAHPWQAAGAVAAGALLLLI